MLQLWMKIQVQLGRSHPLRIFLNGSKRECKHAWGTFTFRMNVEASLNSGIFVLFFFKGICIIQKYMHHICICIIQMLFSIFLKIIAETSHFFFQKMYDTK